MSDNQIDVLIIGDEILSGKREDKHFKKMLEIAKKYNYQISSSTYLTDSPQSIELFIQNNSNKILFSFGGIGATPDDHTRQSTAKALKKELTPHKEAISLIEQKFGKDAYPKRVLMGHLPEGAKLLPNEINQIPGFYLHHLFFMPGFPEMAWPMIEWIFRNILPEVKNNFDDQSIIIKEIAESLLIDFMREIEIKFPKVKVYSLPKISPSKQVELGVKGDVSQVSESILVIKKYVKDMGYSF